MANNSPIEKAVELAYQELRFIHDHGGIGPDSAGNEYCRPCMNALRRAIKRLQAHVPEETSEKLYEWPIEHDCGHEAEAKKFRELQQKF